MDFTIESMISPTRHTTQVAIVFVLMLGLVGCGRRDRPAMALVKGKVTYKGAAVKGANVAFFGAKAPRAAAGTTNDSGEFELSTFDPGDGAVVGRHVATVSKPVVPIEEMGIDPNLGREAYIAAMEKAASRAAKSQAAGSQLPAKYADQKTSTLHFDVTSGANSFDIKLSD